MKTLKKNAFAIALSIAVGAGPLVVADEAHAMYRNYYDLVITNDSNPELQLAVAQALVIETARYVERYEALIETYKKYETASWFSLLTDGRDHYQSELDKLNSFINDSGVSISPTIVNTVEEITQSVEVSRSEPTEIDQISSTEELIEDNQHLVFSIVDRLLRVVVTETTYQTTVTTTTYTDNSVDVEEVTEVISTLTRNEDSWITEKTLISSTPINEPSENGIQTENVLSVEEYASRADVNIGSTTTYANAFKRTHGDLLPDSYITSDSGYKAYGDVLSIVKAPDAWAKGWTGQGTKIAILDTGLDINHSEFAGKNIQQKCFASTCSSEGLDDLNGHGTHVAGIAAANLDGAGMTGVAPDADLLIAKVATQGGDYQLGAMATALGWASENDATVANVSGGYAYSSTFRNAVNGSNGDFFISSPESSSLLTSWHLNGYNGLNTGWLVESMVSNFAESETVMVASAGNQGLPYAGYPGHFAVHTDEAGNLTFDGRIIVAGSYDAKKGDLASYSNAAGTLCTTDSCNTDYRISDFYLMAPGSFVASTSVGGGYEVKTGTSMAAPVISGAVAVVHQMWPHMTGANLAQLLLESGDKSFAGYNVHRHGQGLLDLDAATSPIGELGIPTTGRASGATTSDFGQIGLAGSVETLATEVLSSVMVIDDYDRDFYVDASNLVAPVDTRTQSLTVAHKDLINTNQYAGYAADAKFAGGSQLLFGMSPNGESYSLAYDFNNGISLGYVTEEGTFLGNTMDSDLMRINNAATAYLGYNFDHAFSTKVSIFGGATAGFTSVEVDQSTMLNGADVLISNTANLGARFDTTAGQFGLVAALPVAITSGDAKFRVASDIDFDGNIVYRDIESSLASKNREYNLGLFYNTEIGSNAKLSAFAEKRFNYAGIEGKSELEAGVEFKLRF